MEEQQQQQQQPQQQQQQQSSAPKRQRIQTEREEFVAKQIKNDFKDATTGITPAKFKEIVNWAIKIHCEKMTIDIQHRTCEAVILMKRELDAVLEDVKKTIDALNTDINEKLDKLNWVYRGVEAHVRELRKQINEFK